MSRDQGKHLSLSEAQLKAEKAAIFELRKKFGPTLKERRINIGTAYCQPDGVTEDEKVMVEVYAHIGKLRGAQQKKIATDVLKFAAIKQEEGRERTNCYLVFLDEEARRSVTGWVREAADRFGVELMETLAISPSAVQELKVAQKRQAEGMK